MAKKTMAELEEKLEKKVFEITWHEQQLNRIGALLHEATGGLPSMRKQYSSNLPTSFTAGEAMGMAGMALGKMRELEDMVRIEHNRNTDLLDRYAPKKVEDRMPNE